MFPTHEMQFLRLSLGGQKTAVCRVGVTASVDQMATNDIIVPAKVITGWLIKRPSANDFKEKDSLSNYTIHNVCTFYPTTTSHVNQ